MKFVVRAALAVVGALGATPGLCQSFFYVEPGVAGCPAPPPSPRTAAPRTVVRQVPVPGSLSVACGFAQGSYTVSLNSSDPGATFVPRSFIVNFGRLVGKGAFTVAFSTPGVHRVSASITPNMGSPAVHGHFTSAGDEFHVSEP